MGEEYSLEGLAEGRRHLAGLGVFLLDRLEETAGRRQLGAAAATVLLAEVERRVGRPEVAEDLLKQSVMELQDEPLALETRVSLCRSWAAPRRDQGRLAEALALLERASAVAEELGSYEELAYLRLAEGWQRRRLCRGSSGLTPDRPPGGWNRLFALSR